MLVSEWMTKDVITVTEDTSMMKASRLMRDKKVSRLPVLDAAGKLRGIITDRDIKAASPSRATTLDMHEIYYLISEIKVKEIMTRNPITVKPDDSIEFAATILVDKNIGGLPVVDDSGMVVGIISDSDIFKLLINITGATEGGLQLALELPDAPGSLLTVFQALMEYRAQVLSVLTAKQTADEGTKNVYVRIESLGSETERKLVLDFAKRFKLLYCYPHLNAL